MVLTEKQNEVFDKIKKFIDSDSSVFILRGYAGTGKYNQYGEYTLYPVQNGNLQLQGASKGEAF